MTVSLFESVLEITRLLVSAKSVERARGADEVTDVATSLEQVHVDLLARLLVQLRMHEHNAACREAQLNALCDLAAAHTLDANVLQVLRSLETSSLSRSEMEHLAQLLPQSAPVG